MHELDERLRHQLLRGEPERRLPRPIEPPEVPAEIEDAQHVDREIEEPLFELERRHGGASLIRVDLLTATGRAGKIV